MAVELVAKIKPKNNGKFKLVDSIDVEMSNGEDLQSYIDNLDVSSGGSSDNFSIILNGEETSDYKFKIDLNEVEEAYNDVSSTILEQIQSMFNFLNDKIEQQAKRINELELEIEDIKSNGSYKPSTTIGRIVDYEGNTLVDYDGNTISDYKNNNTNNVIYISDYKGYNLVDYNGNILADYENNDNYLVDYNGNILVDYENNKIIV